jgi:hypothetical protein
MKVYKDEVEVIALDNINLNIKSRQISGHIRPQRPRKKHSAQDDWIAGYSTSGQILLKGIEKSFAKASPAMCVLSTDEEDKMTWIKTGVLFETLFLMAAQMEVRFDIFSQTIAIPELRQEMAQILNTKYPQMLIRMGYAKPGKHTPRRSAEEVLLS